MVSYCLMLCKFLNILIVYGKSPRTMNDTVCKSNNTRKYLVDMYKWSVMNLQILRRFSFLLELLKEDQFIPILGPIKGEQHILRFSILQSRSRPKCNGIYEKRWQVNEIKFRFLDFIL